MKTKSNLLLFLVITTILLTSPLLSGDAFADKDDDKKKKTFEEMCAKKKGNSPDALFCQAILGVQQSIDSFFDIFVELADVADIQCPQGQVATGTNIDGTLLCTDITQNQDCDDGYYVSGIDDNGQIKCKLLPSGSSVCGDGIITAPETCDDGNFVSGDGCSATCSAEEAQCTDGQPLAEQTYGDCKERVQCPDGNIGSNPDDSDIVEFPPVACMQSTCSDGILSITNLPSGTVCSEGGLCDGTGNCVATDVCGDGIVTAPETCDDGNFVSGDGCSAVCEVETGFYCVGNPSVCSTDCGDGKVAGAEECDGSVPDGLSCLDYGFYPPKGSLSCNPFSCTISISSCSCDGPCS